MKIQIIRQGDLGFVSIAEIPKNVKELKFNSEFVLATGEATGHRHLLVTDYPETKIRIFQDINDRHFLDISGGSASVKHEEHKTKILSPRFYIQEQQVEYDELEELEKMRKVKD